MNGAEASENPSPHPKARGLLWLPLLPALAVFTVSLAAAVRVGRVLLARRVERVVHRRLERLVVRRQRPVLQSRRDPDPADAVGMKNERLIAADRVVAFRTFRWLVSRRLLFREVGIVEARPFLLLRIPPDELLPLAPRRSVRTRRRAVVENASIGRPGESPAVTEVIARRARVRKSFCRNE